MAAPPPAKRARPAAPARRPDAAPRSPVPRYTVMLSGSDLQDTLGLVRGEAGFAAATDLETLLRAISACDFLASIGRKFSVTSAALPAAAAVCARLLPGAEPVAAAEARAAFHAVMERTSFGPALWATVSLETVGRLASCCQADARGRAVADMARAELARRLAALPDLELAMLRAHAAGPVAGLARAELLRRHPQLTLMTETSLKAAVRAFGGEGGGGQTADFRHSPKAEAKYGRVGLWDVSKVTSLAYLFAGCENFNEDISAWDVRRAESLRGMLSAASSFSQPLGAWEVSPCADTGDMLDGAAAFELPANAPWYI